MIAALHERGVLAALGAALLFGGGTPFAKKLLEAVDPWLLAGLLYAGSGVSLFVLRRIVRGPRVAMSRNDALWLGAAIGSSRLVRPALLMLRRSSMPASGASLLLDSARAFTAVLAWF